MSSVNKSKVVRDLRKALQEPAGGKLSQEGMARLLGVSHASLNAWENAKTVPTGDNWELLWQMSTMLKLDGGPSPAQLHAALTRANGNRGRLFVELSEINPSVEGDA